MPKKIRIVEETASDEDLDTVDFQHQVLELAKTMDWKLWEILQTMQRLEERVDTLDADTVPSKKTNKK